MTLDKQRNKNIRIACNITSAARFCGFVILIPENDEFIAKVEDNNFVKLIGYSAIPDYAIKYKRYYKAVKASNKCDKYKTIIGYLFDLGEQHFVSFDA
ncbi:hypothetical protein [Colwellia sp. MB3u-55]|jgi:hypothetical protein|uniref:hypothetical protein n=1 Tax=Colwellia sp. MB3u-55 TaxID=2759810 RepID=UPI0015F5C1FD|nr:hypothetical protein [Colwellia sp. MB3u-55]MBA6253646.1 hypothetical protein [Colwellia sp. MB3u-55]